MVSSKSSRGSNPRVPVRINRAAHQRSLEIRGPLAKAAKRFTLEELAVSAYVEEHA